MSRDRVAGSKSRSTPPGRWPTGPSRQGTGRPNPELATSARRAVGRAAAHRSQRRGTRRRRARTAASTGPQPAERGSGWADEAGTPPPWPPPQAASASAMHRVATWVLGHAAEPGVKGGRARRGPRPAGGDEHLVGHDAAVSADEPSRRSSAMARSGPQPWRSSASGSLVRPWISRLASVTRRWHSPIAALAAEAVRAAPAWSSATCGRPGRRAPSGRLGTGHEHVGQRRVAAWPPACRRPAAGRDVERAVEQASAPRGRRGRAPPSARPAPA